MSIQPVLTRLSEESLEPKRIRLGGVIALIRSMSAVSVVNALNGLLGIAFVPLAVARMGVSGYGLFSVYSVLGGYMVLAELGLGKNLVRDLAASSDPQYRLLQLRTALGLYVSICASLLLVLPLLLFVVPRFIFPVPADSRGVLQWITALAAFEYLLGMPVSLMQNRCIADEEFSRFSRFTLASGLTRYTMGFLAVLIVPRPELVVLAFASRRAIELIVARRILGPLPRGAWRPLLSLSAFRPMLSRSSALSLAQLLQLTVVSIGSILVNWFFGVRALGLYRAAFDLAAKVWFFSNIVGLVIFPRLVRIVSDTERRSALAAKLPGVLTASWIGYAAIAVIGAALGPAVLSRVGLGGVEIVGLFVLLLAGVSFNAHSTLSCEFIQASGRYLLAAAIAGLSLIMMIVLFLMLRTTTQLFAIGWAWLVAQTIHAGIIDAVASATVARSGFATRAEVQGKLLALAAVCLSVVAVVGAVRPLAVPVALGMLAIAAFRAMPKHLLVDVRAARTA